MFLVFSRPGRCSGRSAWVGLVTGAGKGMAVWCGVGWWNKAGKDVWAGEGWSRLLVEGSV